MSEATTSDEDNSCQEEGTETRKVDSMPDLEEDLRVQLKLATLCAEISAHG